MEKIIAVWRAEGAIEGLIEFLDPFHGYGMHTLILAYVAFGIAAVYITCRR